MYNSGNIVKALSYLYQNRRIKGNVYDKEWKWDSSHDSIAINRKLWHKMLKCNVYHYCFFDSITWYGSLQHLCEKCYLKIRVLTLAAPQVYALKLCPETKENFCNSTLDILNAMFNLTNNVYIRHIYEMKSSLFYEPPPTISYKFVDKRDRILCYDLITRNNISSNLDNYLSSFLL
ncbi:uncharacterized protein LOC123291578 [Chrysoperla carnea]|uniref:uncharacterized protein LOC123291578 n=1 Tax=Chrysoperla carnea TaxID=189513 RepID=UPI001D069D13|nr:uncharacterized protein LOC123291578 [Chrysoperla carnea]